MNVSQIDDAFDIDFGQPMPEAAGGQTAFAAIDRLAGRTRLMAVKIAPGVPARAAELQRFLATPIAGVLSPIAAITARDPTGQAAPFMICQAPPGPALVPAGTGQFTPWDEYALLTQVLRPVAQTLEHLRHQHITHRAIRPGNMFRAGAGDPVTLGCAWAAPPAFYQPGLFEPPYIAICHPSARGAGSIADDVYALGVTLLVLALGHEPCRDLDPRDLICQQLERGNLATLVGDLRLPPVISDLLRGMLAEDPEHRPTPALLADTEVARSRRVAARPPRRAQRPLDIGSRSIWSARALAGAMTWDAEGGLRALRSGAVNAWVRRSLGDSALAVRLDETVRIRAAQEEEATSLDDAALVMRAVALLDPLAPMAWNGSALWPEGIGPMLAAAGAAEVPSPASIADMLGEEAIGIWASLRAERCDAALLRLSAHQYRSLVVQKGLGGGINRLAYSLNPLLPCRSPLIGAECVMRLDALLPAMEREAAQNRLPGGLLCDAELAAFVAARSDSALDPDVAVVAAAQRPDQAGLAVLRLYAAIQMRTRGAACPRLAVLLAKSVAPVLAAFASRSRREARERALQTTSESGLLADMVAVLADTEAFNADRQEREAALAHAQAIDRMVSDIVAARGQRETMAEHLGHEVVATAGSLGLIYAVMSLVLS